MINSLTSFRFIAALMVFIFHMGVWDHLQLGSAGVQFFFILSGFILAYNYQNKFTHLNKSNIKAFYRARFAKVYPVHLLTFFIAAPLVIIYFKPDGLYYLKLAFMSGINLLLVQSFIPNEGTYFNFNGVSWTLSVEAFFYIMFPFLLWIFSKLQVSKNAIKTISIFALLWLSLFFMNALLDEANRFFVWLLHIFPLMRLFEFSIGIVMGLIFSKSSNPVTINNKLFSLFEVLSLATFAIMLWVSTHLSIGIVRGVYFVPVWCMFIYIFAYQRGIISRLLSLRAFVYLGEISFSFYMIHQLVIRYNELFNLTSPYSFLICFTLSLLLSAAIYHLYEEPLRKKLRYGKMKSGSKRANLKMEYKRTAV